MLGYAAVFQRWDVELRIIISFQSGA
jgi:hypothetical protein